VTTATDWLDDKQQSTWRRFVAVQRRLSARLGQHLQRDSGLSRADYEILLSLSESGQGRMRAFEIGRATQWEKSRLSHHLTRMAQRGLIERQTCAADSRYADIVLTEAGQAAIEHAMVLHVAHLRRYFVDALSPDQLAALDEICGAVLARLEQDAEQDPVVEACTSEDESC
jgi:DNA-binding MarR family transcriptional regulator